MRHGEADKIAREVSALLVIKMTWSQPYHRAQGDPLDELFVLKALKR